MSCPPRPLILALLLVASSAFGPAWAFDPYLVGAQTAPHPAQHWRGPAVPCLFEPPGEQPLTLPEAVDRALCRNPDTREAWAAARGRAAEFGAAHAAFLPALSASATRSRSRTDSQDAVTRETVTTPAATLNYLLFDFGGRNAALEAARETLIAANFAHHAALLSVWLATVQGYYQLHGTRAALEATEAAELSALRTLDAAVLRYEVGAAALIDKLQARTAAAQARLARERAEGELRLARGTLANLLGLDADFSLRMAEPAALEPDPVIEQDIRRLIHEAKSNRPDLAEAEARLRAAGERVAIERSAGLPSLALSGSYSRRDSDLIATSRAGTIGLTLSVPLFSGFDTRYRVQAAEADVEVQRARLTRTSDRVALDVWRAWQTLATAGQAFGTSTEALASALQSEELALGRYQAGVGALLDVLNAQASLAAARVQQVQARYDWYIAKSALTQALGRQDLLTPPPAAGSR